LFRLSHYKPGFNIVAKLERGRHLITVKGKQKHYRYCVAFTFKNHLLAEHYAEQVSKDTLLLGVRPQAYLTELGVRVAFWVGRTFLSADYRPRNDKIAWDSYFESIPASTERIMTTELVSFSKSEEFTAYAQESMSLYANAGARLVLSGDVIQVMHRPSWLADGITWDRFLIFEFPQSLNLYNMKKAISYKTAAKHWRRAVDETNLWVFGITTTK